MWIPILITGLATTVLPETQDWALDGLSMLEIYIFAFLKSLLVTFLPFTGTGLLDFLGLSSSEELSSYDEDDSDYEVSVPTWTPIAILPSLTAYSNRD